MFFLSLSVLIHDWDILKNLMDVCPHVCVFQGARFACIHGKLWWCVRIFWNLSSRFWHCSFSPCDNLGTSAHDILVKKRNNDTSAILKPCWLMRWSGDSSKVSSIVVWGAKQRWCHLGIDMFFELDELVQWTIPVCPITGQKNCLWTHNYCSFKSEYHNVD